MCYYFQPRVSAAQVAYSHATSTESPDSGYTARTPDYRAQQLTSPPPVAAGLFDQLSPSVTSPGSFLYGGKDAAANRKSNVRRKFVNLFKLHIIHGASN